MRGWIEDKTYYKYEDEGMKLRIAKGSWSINLEEIAGKPVEKIVYQTEKAIYTIGFHKARKHGFIRNFRGETKLIVPLKYWEIKGEGK